MSPSNLSFKSLIFSKAKKLGEISRGGQRLNVAVLGSDLSAIGNFGTEKRKQIHDALKKDRHFPFYPEEHIQKEPIESTFLSQEKEVLQDPTVDLVIILHTENSWGVAAEIVRFANEPEISAKSAVLFPIKYYKPEEAVLSNEVREFLIKMPYTDEQFEKCQLVSECRKWANVRATGRWIGMTPHSF